MHGSSRPVSDFMPAPLAPEPEPVPVEDETQYTGAFTVGDTLLIHGYTLRHVEKLARAGMMRFNVGSGGTSHKDRYEAAWSGVVEALYAAEEPPEPNDLIAAGWAAVKNEWHQELQSKGLMASNGTYRPQPGVQFTKYWDQHMTTHFPEERIVERLAAVQVLPLLTEEQREAVAAIAVHPTHKTAATALGIGTTTLTNRLRAAREVFIRWWHEGEDPPNYNRRTAATDERCASGHLWATFAVFWADGRRRCSECQRVSVKRQPSYRDRNRKPVAA